MNRIVNKGTLGAILLVSFLGFSASASAHGGWHGGGGGWHGGGWNGGGWHGGGWNGGGWYGGAVVLGAPYYYYEQCGTVRVCNRFGNCWLQSSCY